MGLLILILVGMGLLAVLSRSMGGYAQRRPNRPQAQPQTGQDQQGQQGQGAQQQATTANTPRSIPIWKNHWLVWPIVLGILVQSVIMLSHIVKKGASFDLDILATPEGLVLYAGVLGVIIYGLWTYEEDTPTNQSVAQVLLACACILTAVLIVVYLKGLSEPKANGLSLPDTRGGWQGLLISIMVCGALVAGVAMCTKGVLQTIAAVLTLVAVGTWFTAYAMFATWEDTEIRAGRNPYFNKHKIAAQMKVSKGELTIQPDGPRSRQRTVQQIIGHDIIKGTFVFTFRAGTLRQLEWDGNKGQCLQLTGGRKINCGEIRDVVKVPALEESSHVVYKGLSEKKGPPQEWWKFTLRLKKP